MGLIVIITLLEGGGSGGSPPENFFLKCFKIHAFSWELNNHVIIGGLYLGSRAIW